MVTVTQDVLDALVAPARTILPKIWLEIDGADVDITPDLMTLDTTDEVTDASADIPYGCVSCNRLDIELNNLDNKYLLDNDKSPYYGKLIAQRKVTLQYRIKVNTGWYVLPKVYYYTDTWKSSTDSGTAHVLCLDYLSLFANKEVPSFRVQEGITFYDAFELLFKLVGIPSDKYRISEKLKYAMTYFWNTGELFQAQLQALCTTAVANVFVDKNEIIQVTSLIDPAVSCWTINDSDLLLNVSAEPTFDSIYSAVRINYKKYQSKSISSIYTNDNVTLKPGFNILADLPFNSDLVTKVVSATLSEGRSLSINKMDYSNRTVTLECFNGSGVTQTVRLDIYGEVIQTSDEVLRLDNRNAEVDNVLEITMNYVSPVALIAIMGKRLLANYSGLVRELTIDVRSMPVLDIYDRIKIHSASTNIEQEYRIKQINNTFDSGLTGSIVVTVPTDKASSGFVFVGPGQIIGV